MRGIALAVALAAMLSTGACNTVRGIGRDARSLGEVLPSSVYSGQQTASAPAAAPAPTGTPESGETAAQ
jgi:predicted small secreted protein